MRFTLSAGILAMSTYLHDDGLLQFRRQLGRPLAEHFVNALRVRQNKGAGQAARLVQLAI
jgi:hypothetical protein